MDPTDEAGAPAVEEVPLVLVAEPQAPTCARHIVHFLQTGVLLGNQDKAEKYPGGPVCIILSMTLYTEEGPTV